MINTIYIMKNLINNKVYIGQTWKSLDERWRYGCGYRGCFKIERAIKKYGKNNFYYEVLTFCSTQESADYCETYFIEKYNSVATGYNICISGFSSPMTGRKHSVSSRAKMSSSRKGKYTGSKNPFFGRHHSIETKQKIVYMNRDKKKIFGRTHSNETKEKISKAGLGKRKSIATEFKKGKKWVPNICTKVTSEIAEKIRQDHLCGISGLELADKYKLSRASISRIINNKSWVR